MKLDLYVSNDNCGTDVTYVSALICRSAGATAMKSDNAGCGGGGAVDGLALTSDWRSSKLRMRSLTTRSKTPAGTAMLMPLAAVT